jgi:hypothetical protein
MYYEVEEYLLIGIALMLLNFTLTLGMKVHEWYIDQMALKQKISNTHTTLLLSKVC